MNNHILHVMTIPGFLLQVIHWELPRHPLVPDQNQTNDKLLVLLTHLYARVYPTTAWLRKLKNVNRNSEKMKAARQRTLR